MKKIFGANRQETNKKQMYGKLFTEKRNQEVGEEFTKEATIIESKAHQHSVKLLDSTMFLDNVHNFEMRAGAGTTLFLLTICTKIEITYMPSVV
ncbi:9863_t:CDS:2 [Diversispora eburnea]|uniref:9863_t:CDS:1 n=1 Tax=Diversispora eburnea TaxID=1213867 RepID=A0A9N8UZP7_9GLOM|nr:9863_t:CDS:2 [Diversispora eburnea]